jgi:gliding motility-associated-like protein
VRRFLCNLLLLFVLLISNYNKGFAQGNTSNQGTDFWTAYMLHIDGAGISGSKMALYITGDVNTTGKVDLADGMSSQSFTVTANQITVVDIPTSAYLSTAGQALKGIHITSEKPIVVYAHIYYAARSGATLVLPVAALAKDYYTINYTQNQPSIGTGYNTFCVIATEDNTTVEITPSALLTNGNAANVKLNITLNKGELYQGWSLTDLTGTRIRSVSTGAQGCKRIAVYSGSSFTWIGCNGLNSGDNLFQQTYPTASWGKNFVTSPLSGRAYDIFRIVCSDPTANVTVNGAVLPKTQLQNNFYYEIAQSTTPNVITANKPIQVVQYAITMRNGLNCTTRSELRGDPEMIYLSPIEQGLNHVTLFSPAVQAITQSFVNIILPTAAVSTFKFDGQPSTTPFTAIPNSVYSYAQIPVASGVTHNVDASEIFNAIAYGFGNVESYGYAAGTNLKNLNEFIVLQDVNDPSGVTQLQGCTGLVYRLKLSIPFPTTKITWDPGNGSSTTTINSPVPIEVTTRADGTILYTYQFNAPLSFKVGSYTAKATVFNPISTDCGSDEDINFDFNIADPPTVDFDFSTNNCMGGAVTFTDKTNGNGKAIKGWLWDFGDGTTSTEQNPQHIYAIARNYQVTLTVTGETGCNSISSVKTVHVARKPTAAFKISTPDCTGKDITFTDLSVANEGDLTQWTWDFGDGSQPSVVSTNTPIAHQYAAAGTYNVTLQVMNSVGCTSAVFTQAVVVHELPQPNFVMPDACLVDFARFTNTSTIADGTQNLLTYLWDFGDTNAAPAQNISTARNGVHKYSAAGTYKVTLTATSSSGCVSTISQDFFLNSAFPVAKFDMPDQICSSDNLVISDQSTVDLGKITRYEIYYDYDRNRNSIEVYDRNNLPIPSNKIFTHSYGLNNNVGFVDYHVKIMIYSGSSADCSAVFDKQVRVYANPVVALTAPTTLCQEDAPVQINVNTYGFTGQGTFSGGGVNTDGVFNPIKAGPGNHQINYTFYSDAGNCPAQATVNILVNPAPIVTGKRNLTILAGEQITIDPLAVSANGTTLTYLWYPATGLSNPRAMSPVASPKADTEYTLVVTSSNGCTTTVKFNIAVLQQPIVYNTFTPNGDGVNDTWNITNLNRYSNGTVEVFNRNGNRVYYSIGYPVSWDGRYNGQQLPAGVYYYIINPKNGKPVLSGSVTIIR